MATASAIESTVGQLAMQANRVVLRIDDTIERTGHDRHRHLQFTVTLAEA
jgi:hypothetical protein